MGHGEPGDFVERMGSALTQAGMPRGASLALAALLVDDDGRMTATELATSLRLSAGAVSGAIAYLVQIGVVRRERVPGSRKQVYVVDDDAWHGAMARTDQTHAPIIGALDAGMAAIGPDSPAHLRLRLTREFLRFVDAEMSALLTRWEERRRELLDDSRGGSGPV
jgi:DNA-binding MarR family transcriptional regulator